MSGCLPGFRRVPKSRPCTWGGTDPHSSPCWGLTGNTGCCCHQADHELTTEAEDTQRCLTRGSPSPCAHPQPGAAPLSHPTAPGPPRAGGVSRSHGGVPGAVPGLGPTPGGPRGRRRSRAVPHGAGSALPQPPAPAPAPAPYPAPLRGRPRSAPPRRLRGMAGAGCPRPRCFLGRSCSGLAALGQPLPHRLRGRLGWSRSPLVPRWPPQRLR